MDETLASVAIDLSGRPYLVYNVNLPKVKIGEFDVELVREFFQAFVNNCGANLHINVMYGDNVHHILEACFKAAGPGARPGHPGGPADRRGSVDQGKTCKNVKAEGLRTSEACVSALEPSAQSLTRVYL